MRLVALETSISCVVVWLFGSIVGWNVTLGTPEGVTSDWDAEGPEILQCCGDASLIKLISSRAQGGDISTVFI
jgi:hypothetical protein